MRTSGILKRLPLIAVAGLSLLVSAGPSFGLSKTCLTGTDPSVANDAAQIVNVRNLIDYSYCYCYNYDGSPGKGHADHHKCAKNVAKAQSLLGYLRPQCVGTVSKIYAQSICGRKPSQHFQACIAKKLTTGKLTCSVKPTTKADGTTPTHACSDSPGKVSRVSCPSYASYQDTNCLGASDSNYDQLIGAGDVLPTLCSGQCANLEADFYNCGTCGNRCPYNGSCTSATCSCPPGQPFVCSNFGYEICSDLQTDFFNCGACNQQCPDYGSCANGACSCPPYYPTLCPNGGAGQCADLQNDFNNCGTCGNRCPYNGGSCASGTCTCPLDRPTVCSNFGYDVCTDLQTDSYNCGACGATCYGGSCVAGVCTCPFGEAPCDGGGSTQCIDVQYDSSNCGACGITCVGGSCSAGACTCPGGQIACPFSNYRICINPATDPDNCGGCGIACSGGQTCVASTCQ